jgi:hypothetical protein
MRCFWFSALELEVIMRSCHGFWCKCKKGPMDSYTIAEKALSGSTSINVLCTYDMHPRYKSSGSSQWRLFRPIPYGGGSDIFWFRDRTPSTLGLSGRHPTKPPSGKQKVQPCRTVSQTLLNCVEDFTNFKRIDILMYERYHRDFEVQLTNV